VRFGASDRYPLSDQNPELRQFSIGVHRNLSNQDSVQGLEEIVYEQFGLERNPQDYWKNQDGGVHIMAVAIYVRYDQAPHDSKTTIPYPHGS
jgi:hypothetical protein